MEYETVKQINEAVLDELSRSLADEAAAKHVHDKRQRAAQDLYNRALLRRIFGDRKQRSNPPTEGSY